MPLFLVESAVAATPEAFDGACDRARCAAASAGDVAYLRTTFLPGGRAVLHLFEAPSADALDLAGKRAGLQCEQIVEAVDDSIVQRKEHGDGCG